MSTCCACGSGDTQVVLDLGRVPAADLFPPADDRGPDPLTPLAMMLCRRCALAQVVDDPTDAEQPLGVEPRALVEQAEVAVFTAQQTGWLGGDTVREFGSPHGGTWLPLLTGRGWTPTDGPGDVVLDSFGVMHEADQAAAWRARAAATTPDGVLLLQVHTLSAIVEARQWTALRHGHAAYYSLTALTRLLASVGMSVVDARTFGLYGAGRIDGTLLVAARHGEHPPSDWVRALLAHEAALGLTDPRSVDTLQQAVETDVKRLRAWLEAERDAGRRVHAYGAASRAVALFALAHVDRGLVASIADASPGKQGRRMPGTDVPIVSPEDLVAADPDVVLVTLPDLVGELRSAWPELAGRWVTESEATA